MDERCPKCDHQFLIMSIWGMPNLDEVERLELEGHTVNIEGCSLPTADEEVFPFECKKCGHKFGDFEDVF